MSHTSKLFHSKVSKTDGGCWLWLGSKTPDGYGRFRGGVAHRFSYEFYRGSIPAGLHCLHRCDVRACVNPGHLFLGTNAENMADRDRKGRQYRPLGEKNRSAKLTESQVLKIRELVATKKHPQREIAARFGIGQAVVSRIASRAAWGHVQ